MLLSESIFSQMACLTALARGMKAAGKGGGIDLLRAQVLIGLVLGTLPFIPAPPGTPPDIPPDPGDPPGDPRPGGAADDGSGPGAGADDGPGSPDGAGGPAGPGASGSAPGGSGGAGSHPADRGPGGRPGPVSGDRGDRGGRGRGGPGGHRRPPGLAGDDPPRRDRPPGRSSRPGRRPAARPARPGNTGPWPPLPGTMTQVPPVLGGPPRAYPAGLSPPPAPDGREGGTRRPPPGLLDLTMSWHVLTGQPAAPARLGRLGPVSTAQALPLAALAAADPAAQWRVIVTDPAGRAIAVERVRRGRLCASPGRAPGVTGRVTVVVPATALASSQPAHPGSGDETSRTRSARSGIRAAVLRAARRAAARAEQARAADEAAGGCAHTAAITAYRPTTRIREHVEARDQTCRQPYCRQPAWRTDLDHTTPWHKGGPTCPCNIGGGCRTHHKIKQQPGWTLRQPRPGHFEWTTPAGRTYRTEPDTYPTKTGLGS